MDKIRLIYNNESVEYTLELVTFFRLVGIYVCEQFWDFDESRFSYPTDLRNEIDNLDIEVEYDCNVFISDNLKELSLYSEFTNDKTIQKNVIITTFNEATDNDNLYVCKNQTDLVKTVLSALEKEEIISLDEKNELVTIMEVVKKEDFVRSYFLAKYFYLFPESSRNIVDTLYGKLKSIVDTFTENLLKKEIDWGSRQLRYTQFACINLLYEIVLFRNKYNDFAEYDAIDMIEICEKLESSFNGFLGNSIKVLEGNIFNDLLSDPNHAYGCFVDACESTSDYNSYVYFKKGLYWQNHTGEGIKAIKYFTRAVEIFRYYYRVWYRLGICYQRSNNLDSALKCYENVKVCLENRLKKNVIRPLESDYLFRSYVQQGIIYLNYDKYNEALNSFLKAEDVYNSIDGSFFYNIISDHDSIRTDVLKSITKNNLQISFVYNRIVFLYDLMGNSEVAGRYRNKTMELAENGDFL